MIRKIFAIDSHTGGEPTRVIWGDQLSLRGNSAAERAQDFLQSHDQLRTALMLEPRGTDAMVGALLLPPSSANAIAEVMFFNNVGVLGMCGHGLIGVVTTLAYQGRIKPGRHGFDTPVGLVQAVLAEDGKVSIYNVESYRTHKDVVIKLDGGRVVRGDVAWGGNWFFLIDAAQHQLVLELSNLEALMQFSTAMRRAVNAQGFAQVDHIELFSKTPEADSRNFVLCPGNAYDRSPCGTGTSAKLACLAADGLLAPEQLWRQQSIVGSVFEARYLFAENGDITPRIHPVISGRAFVTGEANFVLDEADPFCFGIRV
jgi:4-hydroxyproline epimerase